MYHRLAIPLSKGHYGCNAAFELIEFSSRVLLASVQLAAAVNYVCFIYGKQNLAEVAILKLGNDNCTLC